MRAEATARRKGHTELPRVYSHGDETRLVRVSARKPVPFLAITTTAMPSCDWLWIFSLCSIRSRAACMRRLRLPMSLLCTLAAGHDGLPVAATRGGAGVDHHHFDTSICGITRIVIVVESGMEWRRLPLRPPQQSQLPRGLSGLATVGPGSPAVQGNGFLFSVLA
jgi:hypothetical protein